MRTDNRQSLGLFVLRIALGLIFFLHGWTKLFGSSISFFQEMLRMAGWSIPEWVLVVVAVVELAAGLALIIGLYARLAAWLLVVEMIVAVGLFHAREGFFIVAVPNIPLALGFEYHVALIGGLVALAIAGPGWLAVGNRIANRSAPVQG